MGLWDWLRGKPKSVEVVDTVWINQEAKFHGYCIDVDGELLTAPAVLAAAHFPATLARLRGEFAKRNLPHVNQEQRLSAADILRRVASAANAAHVILIQSDALVPDGLRILRLKKGLGFRL